MEIRHPGKRLHYHVVPVLMLVAVLVVLSVITFDRYALPLAGTNARHALTSRILSIKTSSNGLAHISFERHLSAAIGQTTAQQRPSPSSLKAISPGLGETAQLDLAVQPTVRN